MLSRVAVIGPRRAAVVALVQATPSELVDEAAAAEIVHVTGTGGDLLDGLRVARDAHASVVVLHDVPRGSDRRAVAEMGPDLAGITVAVPFVQRYWPMVRLARRRVLSGSPGPLHLLHGWAMDRGGAHWCDLQEFVSGHRIVAIAAAEVPSATADAGRVPGARALVFRTDRGAVGTMSVSRSRPIDGGTLLVVLDGVEESISFHEGRPDVLDVAGRVSTERFQRGVGGDVSRYSLQDAGPPQGQRDCWISFIRDAHAAVGGHLPDGLPTLADLVRADAIEAAIAVSRRAGAWADVRPTPYPTTPTTRRTAAPTLEGTPA